MHTLKIAENDMTEFKKWLNDQIRANQSKMHKAESVSSMTVHYGKASALIEAKEKLQELESKKIDEMGEHYGEN
jgi:cell fate (sporulation/competence/biofilm development) regulator YmcA (YheA/YmcA/DUF963 family)